MSNGFGIQGNDAFNRTGKTVKINGTDFDILANGMKVNSGSIFTTSTDKNGVTTLNLSDNSIFKGTTGEDKNLIIKTNNSDIDFLGGGDHDVKIIGEGNDIKERNWNSTLNEVNDITVTGDKNNATGGTNTTFIIEGNENNASSEHIEAIGSKNSLTGHNLFTKGMNSILTPKGDGAITEVADGSGNHVYNMGSGKNKTIIFDTPGNFLDSKTFTTNYKENYNSDEDTAMKVFDVNGNEKPEAVSIEQEHINTSDVSNGYIDPTTGKTVVLENKVPNLEKLVENIQQDE